MKQVINTALAIMGIEAIFYFKMTITFGDPSQSIMYIFKLALAIIALICNNIRK